MQMATTVYKPVHETTKKQQNITKLLQLSEVHTLCMLSNTPKYS